MSRYEEGLREWTARIERILAVAGFEPAEGQLAVQLNPAQQIAEVGDERRRARHISLGSTPLPRRF